MPTPDFVRVASLSSLADGEMTQVSADGTDILLSRVDGAVHACTAFCTHYGAPLATGVLSGTRVVCPWHHAVFDVASGALCEPPAPDALRTFEVEIRDGEVYVRVPDDADAHGKGIPYRASDGELPDMVSPTIGELGTDAATVAIVGGGAAANAAVEELRAQAFRGRVVLITRETHAPYDRTKLSKGVLSGDAGPDALPLRDGSFYERHGIEVWSDRTVTGIDAEARQVEFDTGEPLAYDACLVATGGTPRRLSVPGSDLDGVYTLRSWEDATEIASAADGAESAIVVGSSFIGMEAASNLTDRGLKVTVIGRDAVPFETVLGEEVGRVFQRAAEAKGVTFRLGVELESIARGEDGLVASLDASGSHEADLVLMGVGVTPATEFLDGAAFRRDDGGLVTDGHLQLVDGLWAAGDVAAYPDPRTGETVRIEHWRLAQQHGRTAARNIASALGEAEGEAFGAVPFFWTGQFGLSLRYVGHAEEWDGVVLDGSLEEPSFLAYYLHEGAVRAVAAVGRDQDAAALHLLMARGDTPSADAVRAGFDPQAELAG